MVVVELTMRDKLKEIITKSDKWLKVFMDLKINLVRPFIIPIDYLRRFNCPGERIK
jgi:hypothetical protein